MSTKTKNVIACVICLAIPMLVGAGSALLSGNIRANYDSMVQAPLSPPGPVFGIIWPILYVLMGASVFLLWTKTNKENRKLPLILFAAQLVLNFAWTPIFFAGGALWLAFGVIIVLDIVVAACIVSFSKFSKWAAALLVPYMLWICFATYLNIAFAILN